MHPFLVRHVTDPLLQWNAGSRVGPLLQELERSQWYPAERLRELQWVRLRALLGHASRSVPYYRSLFCELGAHAEDFLQIDDLERLPVLTKAVVQARAIEVRTDGARGLSRRVTSGSTGIPLQTFMDTRSRNAMMAAGRRVKRWWGLRVGDRHVWLTTSTFSRRRRLRGALLNEAILSSADLSDGALLRLWQRILRFRPASLRANPHALARLAEVVRENGGARGLQLRAIASTAENLYRHQRTLLAETFGCPVINHYGANEFGLIAAECPAGRMHITAENVLVETRPAPGQAGWTELVVTDLNNWGMPLIRYALGDMGAPAAGSCPCGRTLPLLYLRAGRTGDFVVLPGRRYLEYAGLCRIFDDLGAGRVRQFRIIQESLERFTVLIAGAPAAEVEEAVVRGFRAALPAPHTVDVRFVDQIPLDPSGKLRLFMTRVRSPYSEATEPSDPIPLDGRASITVDVAGGLQG